MINENDYIIHPLFSKPVLKVDKKFNMTKDLRHYIENLPMDANDNNLISKNRYILTTDTTLLPLKEYITEWLEFYAHKVHQVKDVNFYITQSWFNINRKDDHHHGHQHKNSIISGVFHLDDDMACLEFTTDEDMFELKLNIENHHLYNARTFQFKTQANTLFLFPSNLKHSVAKSTSSQNRISLSFNTYVKGFTGSKHACTHLDL